MQQRVLFFYSEHPELNHSAWLAQGIDFDIVAQGRTFKEVVSRFIVTMVGQALVDAGSNSTPFFGVSGAPNEDLVRWDEAQEIVLKTDSVIDMSRYSMRLEGGEVVQMPSHLKIQLLPRVELKP